MSDKSDLDEMFITLPPQPPIRWFVGFWNEEPRELKTDEEIDEFIAGPYGSRIPREGIKS